MISAAEEWNPKQALLKSLLGKPERFGETIGLCLDMHGMVHASEVRHTDARTYEDRLWDELTEDAFRWRPGREMMSIAWHLWHLARIEDLTVNILIAGENQVINGEGWLEMMNAGITDTGNAMTDSEVDEFSSGIDMMELKKYRTAVGRRTQEVIAGLKPQDIRRKIEPERLQRILQEKGVLESTLGLLDFWGRKNVGGVLLMPVTRHQIVHLNECFRIKQKYMRRK